MARPAERAPDDLQNTTGDAHGDPVGKGDAGDIKGCPGSCVEKEADAPGPAVRGADGEVAEGVRDEEAVVRRAGRHDGAAEAAAAEARGWRDHPTLHARAPSGTRSAFRNSTTTARRSWYEVRRTRYGTFGS